MKTPRSLVQSIWLINAAGWLVAAMIDVWRPNLLWSAVSRPTVYVISLLMVTLSLLWLPADDHRRR